MTSQPLKIDELKRLFIEHSKTFDENEFAEKCLSQLDEYDPVFKNIEFSGKAMVEGNELFRQKDLDFCKLYQILIRYNECIALAPKNSEEWTSGYANKSAVLFRMRKYNESITEIEKALRVTESMFLKVTLLCRKAECLTALGSADNRGCLEKAKFIMTKLETSEEGKFTLQKLIEKVQSKIEQNKLDIPKRDKRKMQALKLIEEVDRRDLSNLVRVEYSKTYGRHLVAARNFEPGEIVLVEKPYFNSLDDARASHYCDYCFDHLWTIVPCDHCARRLYCSEECRTKSWNEYHEIECFALISMRLAFNLDWTPSIYFLWSVFCKAFKEAGSIEQLVAASESWSQCEDETDNRILLSTDFKNYKSLFTLPVSKLDKDDWESSIKDSTTVLVGLAKYTKILGKTYDFKEIKQLMNDDTAILVGALLLKLDVIINSTSLTVRLVNPNDIGDDWDKFDRPYNKVLPMATMHTLTGCIPNVESFYTHGNKFVICAIRPIKAGDQLIMNFKSESIWDGTTMKCRRQLKHQNLYGCPCECEACTEDWSHILEDAEKLNGAIVVELKSSPAALNLWEERNSILLEWEANCHRPSFPDIKILSKAENLVAVSWKRLSLPSPIMFRSVLILLKILESFYDPSKLHARLPNLRRTRLDRVLEIPDFSQNLMYKNSSVKCVV